MAASRRLDWSNWAAEALPANRSSPVFEELRGLVLKTVGLADVIREAMEPLKEEISAAFVYGSVAKGSDITGSDNDIEAG